MSRPKSYDRKKLLDSITKLFWERGFEATTISQIVARTKVNKFSIYNEFGNKEELFLACINYCNHSTCSYVKEILSKKPLSLKNIEIFFDYRINLYYSTSRKFRDCLIFNSITDRMILNKKTNLQINAYFSEIENLFNRCLSAAKKKKEISYDKDCKILANFLTCFTLGFVNIGFERTKKKNLKKIKSFVLSALKN